MLGNHSPEGNSEDGRAVNAEPIQQTDYVVRHVRQGVVDLRPVGKPDVTVIEGDDTKTGADQSVQQTRAPLDHLCSEPADEDNWNAAVGTRNGILKAQRW